MDTKSTIFMRFFVKQDQSTNGRFKKTNKTIS